MIPGTIEEWKKALMDSKPGAERAACVQALLLLGAEIERRSGCDKQWTPHFQGVVLEHEYRVKPTSRPWNAEDAMRHVGFAYRRIGETFTISIIQSIHKDCYFSAQEYARPIPGTDPATWDWQKCEVVE